MQTELPYPITSSRRFVSAAFHARLAAGTVLCRAASLPARSAARAAIRV